MILSVISIGRKKLISSRMTTICMVNRRLEKWWGDALRQLLVTLLKGLVLGFNWHWVQGQIQIFQKGEGHLTA